MKNRFFFTGIFILISMYSLNIQANVIQKVKGDKVLFSLKGLDPVGPDGVVVIYDSDTPIGKAKVSKIGVKSALAVVYEGKGLVAKGYFVKVLVPGRVGDKVKAKKKVIYNKKTKKEIKRKTTDKKIEKKTSGRRSDSSFSFITGLSFIKMGEPSNSGAQDPKEYGLYKGIIFELNYKLTNMFIPFIGLDYHFASAVTSLPAHFKNNESASVADGNLSDAFIGTHVLLGKYGLPGYYFSAGYILLSGHKLGETNGNLVIRYGGKGLTFGGGHEWVSGHWIYQINARLNRYTYTLYENNTVENETISITQSNFGVNFRIGYLF